VCSVAANVTDLQAVERAVGEAAATLGGLDILVNAAGIASLGDIDEMPPDEWRRMIDVNLMGSYHVARAVWPHMKGQGGGSIIMIASGSGRRAHAGWSAYCASKFGVMGLVNALCKEGRPHGIRCNVICPGPTDTEQRASNFPGEDRSKLLRPGDIAEAAVFFASDESRWVSGPGIDVRREPI
jgi:NAD(P)-dependent dehydrogenase (short-subunit alcohol dehydrogenase family)